EEGRFEFENFMPGEIKEAPFKFRINKPLSELNLTLQILDETVREIRTADLSIQNKNFNSSYLKLKQKQASVLKDNTKIYGTISDDLSQIASASKKSVYSAEGIIDSWVRISSKNGFAGWVKADDIELSGSGANAGNAAALELVFNKPPKIYFDTPPLSTTNSAITIKGYVSDDDLLKNVSIYKVLDKVKLYSPDSSNLPLSLSLKLETGINTFNIIAKDARGNISKKTFTIRKEG
ncbi:MAG: hypothetical protein ACRENO_10580, partial [Thermodesulfobacteriota bacterium]